MAGWIIIATDFMYAFFDHWEEKKGVQHVYMDVYTRMFVYVIIIIATDFMYAFFDHCGRNGGGKYIYISAAAGLIVREDHYQLTTIINRDGRSQHGRISASTQETDDDLIVREDHYQQKIDHHHQSGWEESTWTNFSFHSGN